MPQSIQAKLLELAETLRFFKLYQLSNLIIDISVGLRVHGIETEEQLEEWKKPTP